MQIKKVKKEFLWGAILVFLMVSSVFGIIFGGFSGGTNKVDYNGFKFVRKGDVWSAKINKNEIFFDYFPTEVQDINISSEALNKISSTKMVYFTSNPNSRYSKSIGYSQFRLSESMGKYFNIFSSFGFKENFTERIPLITCENTTQFVPVVDFREANDTKVFLEDGCIIINGNRETDFIRAKDKIIYTLFGIIK